MKIKRTTANKVMSQATRLVDDFLIGIMNKNEMLIKAFTSDELKQLMSESPGSILVYNQSPQALEIRDTIVYADGQQTIQIFQDTAGVFGLRAFLQVGKIQTPVSLELSD